MNKERQTTDDFLNLLNTFGQSKIDKKDLYKYFMGDYNALDKYKGDPETQTTETITIRVLYFNDEEGAGCQELTQTVTFDKVPDQRKVCDKTKLMIDRLYGAVR